MSTAIEKIAAQTAALTGAEVHTDNRNRKLRSFASGVIVIAVIVGLAYAGTSLTRNDSSPKLAAEQAQSRAEAIYGRYNSSAHEAVDGMGLGPALQGLADAANYATQLRNGQIVAWLAGVEAAKQAEAAAIAAKAATKANSASRGSSTQWGKTPSSVANSSDVASTLACIRRHESDTAGGYSALNPSSNAGGAYQALPSTWDGYAGYARAEQAPPAVQDQWAREAIAASGTRPWAGSGC